MRVPSSGGVLDEDETGLPAARSASPLAASRGQLRRISLSSTNAILLAISFGLCAGFLDIAITVLGKYCWNRDGYFRNARDFPWTVPAGHAALLVDSRATDCRA